MLSITINDKIFELSITSDKILEKVKVMAQKINSDLSNEMPLFLVVLNGSFMFGADLLKEITIPCEISFIKLASYTGTNSSGMVKEIIGLTEEIKDRTVVIVEDIVDTGATLETLVELLTKKEVKQIKVATLLFKPKSYTKKIKLDYIGMEIPNEFIIGYGLDYNGLGRNTKDLFILKKQLN